MNRLLPLLLVPAVACLNAEVERKDSGVAVGNPGEMTARTARGGDLEPTDGWAFFSVLSVADCDDGVVDVAVDVAFDLSGDPTILLPQGDWCALGVEGGALELEAESATRSVRIELELDDIELAAESGFTLTGGGTVLQLGPTGWLSGEALELDEPVTVIDEEDDRADDIRFLLAAESVLVEDTDGDRERGDDEPVLAAGEDAEDQPPEVDDEEGEPEAAGGCGGGAAGLGLPLALLALGRRRPWGRPTPPSSRPTPPR